MFNYFYYTQKTGINLRSDRNKITLQTIEKNIKYEMSEIIS